MAKKTKQQEIDELKREVEYLGEKVEDAQKDAKQEADKVRILRESNIRVVKYLEALVDKYLEELRFLRHFIMLLTVSPQNLSEKKLKEISMPARTGSVIDAEPPDPMGRRLYE